MGRGIISAELIRSQRFYIEMRTSDPANPAPGRVWARTDLDGETNKLGELRFYDGSQVRRAWLMAPGSTPDGVEEYWRMQTPAGVAVAPLSPRTDAAHPEQSWSTPGGTYGVWSPPELDVSTLSAADVDGESARLRGEMVQMTFTDSVQTYFQWQQAGASQWNETPVQTVGGEVQFDETISGLAQDQEYDFRALAEDSEHPEYGDTGAVVNFVTQVPRPDDSDLEDGWDTDEGSGSTLNDDYGPNNRQASMTSGQSWRSGGYNGWHIRFTSDSTTEVDMPNSYDTNLNGNSNFTFMWVMRPLGQYNTDRGVYYGSNTRLRFGYGASSGDISVGSNEFGFQINESVWHGNKVSAPANDIDEWQMWTMVYQHNTALRLFYWDQLMFEESYGSGSFDARSINNRMRGRNFDSTTFYLFGTRLNASEITDWSDYFKGELGLS